jgi:uncharacterized membrane protein YbaN (DUF454 family)
VNGILKALLIALGAAAVVLGALTFWLPLPVGLPLMLVGAALLIRSSARARAWSVRLVERYPRTLGFLRRLHQRP